MAALFVERGTAPGGKESPMRVPGSGVIAPVCGPRERRITPGGPSRYGTLTRGDEMRRPGITAVVALAALGGGWSGPPAEGVPLPGGGPELRITKTVTPDPLIIGGESVYAVTVTNTGDQDAENVTIIDAVGPGTAPGPLPRGCSLAGLIITCGGTGLTIPAGQSVAYELPVMIDPSLPDGTDITTRARVTAPHAPGDTTQLTSRTRTMADVEVVTTGPPTVSEGAGITYTVTVTNNGPSPAVDVTVQDLADGDRTTLTGRPAACGGDPLTTCRLGVLGPRESRTLSFAAAPGVTGPIESCATVHTASREVNTANNRSCASTAVEPVRPTRTPAPPPVRTRSAELAEEPVPTPVRAPGTEPRPAGGEPRAAGASSEGEKLGPDAPSPTPAGGGAPVVPKPAGQTLPMTGVSLWLIGLGAPVLLAVGLLVRFFSRRDPSDRTP